MNAIRKCIEFCIEGAHYNAVMDRPMLVKSDKVSPIDRQNGAICRNGVIEDCLVGDSFIGVPGLQRGHDIMP